MLNLHRLLQRGKRNPPKSVHGPAAFQRGIVLVEVLVAILLFILGVVGLVGLQSSMTRAQTEAKIRADATFLATEVMGRLWSDVNNVSLYNGGGCAGLPRCKEWQDKVSRELPGGTGAITVDALTGDVAVTVSWSLPSGETHQYVANTTVIKAGT
jgi:type IV pilus assembly protein PilV